MAAPICDRNYTRFEVGYSLVYSYRNFHYKRMLPLALILVVLGFGMFFYIKNQDQIANFKPYYYKSYVAAYKYKFNHLFKTTNSKPQGDTQSVPVLLYHGVISDEPDGTSVTIDNFIAQMVSLKEAGYQTISLQQYYDFVVSGKQLPDKSFLLTFDDGRKDSYYPAKPLLESLGYQATMFVITGMSYPKSNQFYLSPEELAKMQASKTWSLQPHTKDGHSLYQIDEHAKGRFYTNKLWLQDQKRHETDQEYTDRIRADLVGAKDDLEKNLSIHTLAMAFPFGDIGENNTNFPDARGILLDQTKTVYPLAFIQFNPARGFTQNYMGSNKFLNKRIDVLHSWSANDLKNVLEGSYPKPLPFSKKPAASDGWLGTWGNKFFTNEGMTLQASPNTLGASAHLDGSYLWQNYVVSSAIRMRTGDSVKVLLRLQDADNYLSCSYSAAGVQLQQVINGTPETLAKGQAPVQLTDAINLVGSVKDNAASCAVPGGTEISANISNPELTKNGGLGYVISNSAIGTAEGTVEYVTVDPLD